MWLHAFSPSTLKGEAGGSLLVPGLHHKTVFSKRGSSGGHGKVGDGGMRKIYENNSLKYIIISNSVYANLKIKM